MAKVTDYKHLYRCQGVIDESTGKFITDLKGNLDVNDVNIICEKGITIYDYSTRRGIFACYIPSLTVGRRIIKDIYSSYYDDYETRITTTKQWRNGEVEVTDYDNFYAYINKLKDFIITDIVEYADAIQFRFHHTKLETIAKFIKIKPPFSNTSPFNVKYTPAYKEKLKAKNEANAKYNTYDCPKGYYDKIKVILQEICKLNKCKLNEALELLYTNFEEIKGNNYRQEAEENLYKINHWLLKNGLWDEFVSESERYLSVLQEK